MNDFLTDLRFALRTLRRHPGFAIVAIVTLALGIGANTAMFSLASAALFRSPPVRNPERLVAVYTTCRLGDPRCSSSYPDYLDYRERATTLTELSAYTFTTASLGDDAGAELVTVQPTSGNYFSMLGVRPGLGRLILSADDQRGEASQVAVMSQELWRGRFGGDSTIIGRAIRLNGARFEVVGVVPRGFRGLDLGGGPDVYIPFLSGIALGTSFWDDPGRLDDRGSRWIAQLVGRMAEQVTVEQVRSQMLAISNALRVEDPEARGPRSITVDPLPGYILPTGARADLQRFVILLLAVVGLALLIACANLANLLLARALARRREIGVRLAVGASRGRLVRQLVTESVTLAVVGGGAGLIIATWALAVLGRFDLPGGITIGQLNVGIDGRMLAIAGTLSLLTGVLFGGIPALQASRPSQVHALKRDSLEGAGRGWTRRGLVALQVAVAFLLLVGSGLFLRTLGNSLRFDPGFRPERVAMAQFNLSLGHYSPEQGQAFAQWLVERLTQAPAVEAAGLGSSVPLARGGFSGTFVSVAGYDPAPDEEMRVDYVFVTPAYFRSLGMRVVAGRSVTADDRATTAPAIVVSEAAAKRWWPGGKAVGGRMTIGGGEREVVGIVADANWRQLGETPTPFVFVPLAQFSAQAVSRPITLIVRTRGDPRAVLPVIQSEVTALDSDVSLASLETMSDRMSAVLMPQRMGTVLLTLFALLAVGLAAVGIFGVVSFNVTRDRRSIGIRMALGAHRSQVVMLSVRRMLAPVSIGLAAGLVAAAFLARGMERFLFGVGPRDAVTYLLLGVLLAAIATLAALLPARRAARLDPVEALRHD